LKAKCQFFLLDIVDIRWKQIKIFLISLPTDKITFWSSLDNQTFFGLETSLSPIFLASLSDIFTITHGEITKFSK